MPLRRLLLAPGRPAGLSDLQPSSNYGGVQEGYPCKPFNEMKIKGLLRAAENAFPSMPVHLLPPAREYPEADRSPGGFGPVELLPPVACLGAFHSKAIDPGYDRSSLAVVWFQATPEAPSADRDDPALRGLRWEELARDHEL